jgi:hypothetical protein
MAKFDAGTAVDPMEVDFSKYDGPVGAIPEPDGDQVEAFFDRLKEMRKKRGGLIEQGERLQEAGDQEAISKFLDEFPEDELKSESKEAFKWVEDLTSGYLQAVMLERVPPRVWAKFLRWLAGELSPKAND